MEDWQIDFEYLKIQHQIQDRFDRSGLPDLNAILFLIGIQELGHLAPSYSKEQKQDLIHIAVCRLLSQEGFYHFLGRDEEGWPHWQANKRINAQGPEEQEGLLKRNVVVYFNEHKKQIV